MIDTYSIAQVEALTGIHAPTLRMWEKRYQFIQPHRTDTNIRYYSGEQLKQLLNVSVLIDAGYKISKISRMQEQDLLETSSRIQEDALTDHAEIKAMVISMLEFSEEKFEEIFRISTIRRGLLETITKIIYPFMQQVGILWGTNKLIPAQEHFVSNLIRKKIFSAIDLITEPVRTDKTVVLFLPEKEEHELSLLLAYFIFKNAGWRTLYLGVNVPLENIQQIEADLSPDFLFTSLVISPDNDPLRQFKRILSHVATPLLVTGNPRMLPNEESDKYRKMNSPDDLLRFIRTEK